MTTDFLDILNNVKCRTFNFILNFQGLKPEIKITIKEQKVGKNVEHFFSS